MADTKGDEVLRQARIAATGAATTLWCCFTPDIRSGRMDYNAITKAIDALVVARIAEYAARQDALKSVHVKDGSERSGKE